MKKQINIRLNKVKLNSLNLRIRKYYPSLYKSAGGEYIHNLLQELYGVPGKKQIKREYHLKLNI